jgi:hypothetical protein
LNDPISEEGSRLFAGLCHSFIYQRTIRNQSLTIGQMLWRTVRSGKPRREPARLALAGFSSRRRGGLVHDCIGTQSMGCTDR